MSQVRQLFIFKKVRFSCLAALVSLVSSHTGAEISPQIQYEVTPFSEYSTGIYSGKNVYYRKKRGSFDNEPMNEVVPVDRPSDLPPPTVVAPSPLPIVREYAAGKVFTKADLKGEDAVFQRIFDDIERDKCVLDPKSCEPGPPSKQSRKFLPSD